MNQPPRLHLISEDEQDTRTGNSEIILLGFKNLQNWKIPFFILIFTIYCVTITGNVLIITLVAFCRKLHSPMYIFLAQLSGSDLLLTTNIVPSTLVNVLRGGLSLSFSCCIAQLYIWGGSVKFECLILTVMAYDRYLAICNPLRYSTIMSLNLLLILSIVSWLLGFFVMSMTTVNVLTLEFCGSNIIDHFFCDLAPILLLSCSETSTVKLVEELLSIPALIFPLTLTGASYVCIIRAILRISSNVGRQKAFSTCGSHLTVVCIYYGTLIATYMLPPKGLSLEGSKAISLLYTAVTPMMNPIIYSLRNIEIKNAITFFSRNKLNINKFHYERT